MILALLTRGERSPIGCAERTLTFSNLKRAFALIARGCLVRYIYVSQALSYGCFLIANNCRSFAGSILRVELCALFAARPQMADRALLAALTEPWVSALSGGNPSHKTH